LPDGVEVAAPRSNRVAFADLATLIDTGSLG